MAEPLPRRTGWTPQVVDLGGGLGVPTQPGERAPSIAEFVGALAGGLAVDAQVILEPGRSLVGQAGVTLYRVGSSSAPVTAPGSRSTAASPTTRGPSSTTRATPPRRDRGWTPSRRDVRRRRQHCESGDVLIDAGRPRRAAPRRPARGSRDGRVHARDGVELQRGAAAGRRPCLGRRRAPDPPARDARRPAGARGLGGRRRSHRDRHRRRRRDRACDRRAARVGGRHRHRCRRRRSPRPVDCPSRRRARLFERLDALDILVNNAGGVFETW